jgi:hypothetical protein
MIYDALALQLVCHAVGDYVLQNHWMAINKTQAWPPALVHALFYTVPFAVVFGLVPALAVIGVTHAIIDRYRLANLWVKFWGIGCQGWVVHEIKYRIARRKRLQEEARRARMGLLRQTVAAFKTDPKALAAMEDAPPWLGVWLMIIADNVFHVIINAVALYYLGDLS